ncbi:PAS domain S-box protein [Microcoleus sp. N9_B2]|uniref:PAS domain S-box protein n=1 Tax=unclassified Microcoleus TaxID=2642155 RepID=UPI002FD78482
MSKFPPEKTQLPQQENTTAEVLRQDHFEAFFAGANAGMMIYDSQLRYVSINEVLAQINGIPVADHIGRSLGEMLPDLAPTLEPMLQGILDTGKPILDYEVVGETPKQPGILRYWETSYYPLLDENGRVFGVGVIVIEISDRKRAEQKQARLTAILEATSDLVGVCDTAGHSVYLNQAGQEMLGMSPEEARSPFSLDSVLAPSATAKFQDEAFPTALREGRWAGEILFLSRDGEEIPVSQVLIVHKTAAGEVEFISTVARDIREQQAALRDRKKAEEERQLLATTIENSRDFIGVASMDGRPMLLNQAGMDLMGLSSVDEAKTKHITDFFMPEDLDFVQQYILPVLMKEGSWRSDFRLRHFVTGQPIAVDYTLFLVNHPETNEPIGIATITRDIRDRKKAEDVLKQNEERFRSLIEATAQSIWIGNAEGELASEQPTLGAFTGLTFEEYKGRGWLDTIHPDDRARVGSIWSAAVANRSLYEDELRMRRYDGEYRYMSCRGIPILNADGSVREWVGANTDITDRKQVEEALHEQQAALRDRNLLLSSILESTPDIIVVKDREGRYVALNSEVANSFYGRPIEQIIGKDDSELLPSASALVIMAKDRELMEAGITETYEEEVFNGKETTSFLTTKAPWRDAQGNILGLIAIARNIGDRKQMEAKLRDRNFLLNSILESTPDIIVVKDLEGRYVALNSNVANFLGKPIEEIIGKDDLELMSADSAREIMAKDRQVMAAGITETFEDEISADDETPTTFLTTKAPWRDAKGNILGIIATSRDISDRKQAEDAIKQSEERYRSLILATSQIVWTGDSEGRCWDMPTLRAYTGQTEAEVIGFGWLDAIHPDDREQTAQVWMEAVQTKSLYDIEYRIRGADGNYRYFQGRGVPILNEDGSIREWVGTCTDIHDRKQAEFVLSKAKEAAEAASRAKSEFLANMSHELRTPLNGIMGYAQILQRSKVLKEEERSRIDVIYQCGSHLLTLINDILDLSKIEAQKVELQPTDFHFPAFLQGVAEMCRIRAELKGIQFHFPSSPELPIGIRADEKRLRQVLINLLSNAIKFTDAGTVTFIVSFATHEKIRFEIRDTGTGIAQDQLQTIFQPFEQVGDRRRQTEGTGLGLAISKRIVELMGSTIQVQSEMNVGSIFWFDVDLYQADEWVKTSQIDHRGQIIGIKGRQPKIVVIDDKWANRSVVSNLLSPIGFEVSEANDGQEGWEKIIEVQPDLIVTDLLMPELDGYELIKRVRESENFKDMVIIVSSASVFETDQYRSLEAGGNTFIPKPVQATELLQKLQQYLDLEWVYEANEEPLARSSDTNELIAPPATEMEILYELAMKGNFLEIVKQAALLEEIDPKYIPFAKILYQMAKDFQDEEILTFIESYK